MMQSKLLDIINSDLTIHFIVSSRTQEISLLLQCESIDSSLCNRQHREIKDGMTTKYKNLITNNDDNN